MDVFARLAVAVRRQNEEGDLPDFIVPLLLKVAGHPEQFAGHEELVTKLVQAVEEYETYAFTCCEKIGFGLEDIRRILDKLRVSY